MKKMICIPTLIFLLSGCSDDIHDMEIQVTEDVFQKLKMLEPIQLISAYDDTSLSEFNCQDNLRLGSKGFLITANDTEISNDMAQWTCARFMQAMNCPSMTIISSGTNAMLTGIEGSKSDFSKSDVQQCALEAISFAPESMIPTSQELKNKQSWG